MATATGATDRARWRLWPRGFLPLALCEFWERFSLAGLKSVSPWVLIDHILPGERGFDFRQARRFYGLANTLSGSSRDSLKFQHDPFFTQRDYDYGTGILQYHVMDRVDLGALTLSGGWKGVRVSNRANAIVAGPLSSGRIASQDWFLPQVGVLFHVTDNAELFANYTENFRAVRLRRYVGPVRDQPGEIRRERRT